MPAVPLLLVGAAASGAAAAVGSFVASTLVGATVSGLAATAIGTGVISGAITAAQGGKVSDVLKSAVVSGASSFVGGYVGDFVGTSVAEATGYKVAGTVSGGFARGITEGLIRGTDLKTAALSGLAGSVGAALNGIPTFSNLPDPVRAAVTATARAGITGQSIPEALVQSLAASSGILDSAIKSIPNSESLFADPKNSNVIQLVTGTLSGALTAAVQGGDIGEAARRALINTSADIFQKSLQGGLLEGKISAAQRSYAEIESAHDELLRNYESQQEYYGKAKSIADTVTTMDAERQRLVDDYNAKNARRAELAILAEDNWQYSEEHEKYQVLTREAVTRANQYAEQLNDFWKQNENLFTEATERLTDLQKVQPLLENKYVQANTTLTDATEELNDIATELTARTNMQLVTALDPDFNPDEYLALNNLGPGEGMDPYEHYLSTGRAEGLDTNYKTAKEQNSLVSEALEASGVDPDTVDLTKIRKTVNGAADIESATQELARLGVTDAATQANLLDLKFDSAYTSSAEVQAELKKRGNFKYSDSDVRALTGAAPDADIASAVDQYVDARVIDEDEVRAAYETLGLKKPTQEDIKKLIGQYDESELKGKVEESLPAARYNSIIEQLNALAGGTATEEALAALDTIKRDFNAQLTDLGVDITTISSEVADTKDALTQAIEDAQKGNVDKFESIDKAIADLKAAGLTDEQVQKIVDESSKGVSKDFKDALDAAVAGNTEALNTVKTDLETKIGDVQTALETALGEQKDAFDAQVKDLMDQGKTYQEATETALKDMGVQIDDLGEDFANKLQDTSDALSKQIEEVTTQISDVEKTLLDKIAENEDAGLERDEALNKAVDDVAKDLGKTRDDILEQLGVTEDALAERVDTLSKAVSEQIETLEKDIIDKIAKYEEAGLERDEALAKAVEDVAEGLNTTKEDILDQLGETETTLSERIDERIEEVTTQIKDTETAIYTKMAEYEEAGLERDEALAKAVDEVADDLNTTKEDLLKQLDTTEEALNKRVTDVEDSLGTKIAESQEAVLEELGLVKAGLAEDIAGVEKGLTTKIEDIEASILDRVAEYETAGISRDEALAKAVDDVAGDLNTTREDILDRISKSETGLQEEITNARQEILDRAEEYEKAGLARDEALQQAVTDTEARLGKSLSELQTVIGRPEAAATQEDLNTILNLLQQQGAYDPQYDYNGDQVIDEKDRAAVAEVLRSMEEGYTPDPNQPFRFAPAAGTKWAATGIYGNIAAEAERTRAAQQQAIANEAERTRAAQAQSALKTQRLGNLNTMMQMLSQSGDIGGQQVTVKAADPAKIGYIYDWSSIFANPAQEKLFASPYAQGGAVRSEEDDVNEELLKILRG